MPILYAGNPELAKHALVADPKGALDQFRRLWSYLLTPEEVTAEEACALLRRPREGASSRPLGKPLHGEPHPAPPLPREDPTGTHTHPAVARRKFRPDLLSCMPWYRARIGGKGKSKLQDNISRRVSESVTVSTWARHNSAWNRLQEFAKHMGKEIVWPLCARTILDFASWCDEELGLQSSTIRAYIHSLSRVQQMMGYENVSIGKIPLLEDFLKGCENVPRVTVGRARKKLQRKAVSFSLLRLLVHQVGKSDWSLYKKCKVWAAYLLGFFGAMRVGEILPSSKKGFDPRSVLLWKDLKFPADGTMRVKVKSPKVTTPGGDEIVLFSYPRKGMCPIEAIKSLQSEAERLGLREEGMPIFREETGENWIRAHYQKDLESLMKRVGVLKEGEQVTGHSFRSGIASLLASSPSTQHVEALKEWGRWRSSAYQSYTRHHVSSRRRIFKIICQLLQ
jgi:hypothetical protein